MSTLYIIATPIGNLEDISLRAIRILKEVKLIAAEDTRKTRRLLNAYKINTPITSYYEHNKLTKLAYVMEQLANKDVALVSEAGMPGISDPGYELISSAINQGIHLTAVPGASALTVAITVSGLPTDRFLFLGFLPPRVNARRRLLKEISTEKSTIIIYEAPHRLIASLTDILTILGDRHIAICRELTKLHEEVFRGTISDAISHFTKPRGEFTLVISGAADKIEQETVDIELEVSKLRHSGKTVREAINILTNQTGLSRKELYRIWIKQK